LVSELEMKQIMSGATTSFSETRHQLPFLIIKTSMGHVHLR